MKIKAALYGVIVAILVLFPLLTWAGLPEALAAWDRLDYATALRKSAEQGVAEA